VAAAIGRGPAPNRRRRCYDPDKGEAGSGNIVEAVRHLRSLRSEMRRLTLLGQEELVHESKTLGAPLALVEIVAKTGKLPVPNFAAGGVATPADAALCMC